MTDTTGRLATSLADRYRIERELGSGGMATVYLARDLRHDRDVAVKVLHPDLGAALGGERFLSEIKTTARLQHPHILPLLDSGAADGLLYYVMPFVRGETLRARLERERQLPLADAIRIAREVAGALDHAHRQGVVHRDVKPENILLQDGSAVVTDFGIALAVEQAGGARLTQTGLSLGTPHYMAPEQAMGERTVDARADIYALGAVTYEMLAGDPPFTGSSVQAIVARVLTERPTPLRTIRDTVPPHVEDAVLTALAKVPADRFASAAELAAALATHTGRATAPALAVPERRSAAAARRVAIAAGVVAVASLAIAGWALTRPAPTATAPLVNRFEVSGPPGARVVLPQMGRGTVLGISPDGQRLVFGVRHPQIGGGLALRRLDELTARVLPGTQGAENPAFSPDGRRIAFSDREGRIRTLALDGGTIVTVCNVPGGAAGITWISDREIVFSPVVSRDSTSGLYRVPSDGGTPTVFSRVDRKSGENRHLAPRAVAGGSLVLYTSDVGSATGLALGVVRTADGSARVFRQLRGAHVVGMSGNVLVYAQSDGALMAVPFDLEALDVGTPVQVGDSVAAVGFEAAAALSESGTLFYQSAATLGQLVRVSERGEAAALLPVAQRFAHPRLSPDGRRLAFEQVAAGSSDIWIADLAGGTLERLTREAANDRPEWTPDGRRVLYNTTRTRPTSIWWQVADGSAPAEQLHADPTNPIRESVLTPDGLTLIYRVDTPTDNRDVFSVPVGGSSRSPVLVLGGMDDDKQPRPSPDGKWLAYVSNSSGREEVYVRSFEPGGGRVLVSASGGGEPLWGRDGRLFYRAADSVFVATLATAPSLAVTSRRLLFAGPYATDPFHPNYDVSPDGRSFVMIRILDEELRLTLVINWASELRRRLGQSEAPR